MPETTTPPRPRTERESRGKIVIEIATEHNNYVTFGPTQEVLRGRWLKANVPGQCINEHVDAIPDTPGIWIVVDPSRKTVQLVDPIGNDDQKELLAKVEYLRFGEARVQNVKHGPYKFAPPKEVDDTEIKTWLRQMRILLDNKQAIEVSGTVPTMEEIKDLPGKTRYQFFNSSTRACKFLEDAKEHDDKMENTMKV